MENKKVLPILFFIMFLVFIGFGIIIPVLPFYAEDLGASPTELGLLMAVYSFMQLLFAPLWGRLSDQIGRKPILIIGISGLAFSFFLMAIADSLFMLFVARILGGTLSAANMPTAMAYVADITTEENRSKGMGIVGAATGLGFIFGPAVGGVFSDISFTLPFYISALSSLITCILVIFVLKESLPEEKRKLKGSGPTPSRWNAFKGTTAILFILQFFISVSLAGLEATYAYFAAEQAGLQSKHIGYIFMLMGLGSAIVQGGVMGPLAKKFGEGKIIQAGIIVSAIGFSLILFTDSFATAAIFLTIFGVGNGVIRPAISALLTKTSSEGHGNITGLLSSFDSLGRIIGPPLGGLIFSLHIFLPYISGVILSLFALLLFQVYRVRLRNIENS